MIPFIKNNLTHPMPTPAIDWAADRRLDILILGPMGDKDMEPSTLRIRDALMPKGNAEGVRPLFVSYLDYDPSGQCDFC